jgi:pyruvate/2-oxoglutarate dehydrogenase complex dihydrolipoamide acyltransferase (E2) component
MENEDETLEQKEVIARIQESREAEAIANQRLEDIALQQIEREPVRFDKEALRKEDKERQQRLSEQENKVTQVSRWRLPLSGRPQTREEELVRFRNDIQRRGLAFTASKHACEKKDVRAEAIRLGLKIDWDRVRR